MIVSYTTADDLSGYRLSTFCEAQNIILNLGVCTNCKQGEVLILSLHSSISFNASKAFKFPLKLTLCYRLGSDRLLKFNKT